MIFRDQFAEGLQVEFLQSALWLHILQLMCDEQLSVHEVNIGFDTGEPLFESIPKRMHMLVVVVGMSLSQRQAERLRGGAAQDRPRDCEEKDCCAHAFYL